MKVKPTPWLQVKAKIILRYGSVSGAAGALKCTTSAIRYAVEGKCPKVWERLQKALA
jgi:hypothetical protein